MIKTGIWMLVLSKFLFVLSAAGLILGFNKLNSADIGENTDFITGVITRNTWLSISGLIIVTAAFVLLSAGKLISYFQQQRRLSDAEENLEDIEELPI